MKTDADNNSSTPTATRIRRNDFSMNLCYWLVHVRKPEAPTLMQDLTGKLILLTIKLEVRFLKIMLSYTSSVDLLDVVVEMHVRTVAASCSLLQLWHIRCGLRSKWQIMARACSAQLHPHLSANKWLVDHTSDGQCQFQLPHIALSSLGPAATAMPTDPTECSKKWD